MLFIKSYYKSIIWGLIIVFLLFTPGDKLPESRLLNFKGADKLIHIFLFTVFQFLVMLESQTVFTLLKLKRIMFLLLFTSLFAVSTEIIQQNFIEKRQGSIYDLFADVIGIIIALAAFVIYKKFTNQSYHQIS
jgi:VanZ family protein